jgi:hypothetical protein
LTIPNAKKNTIFISIDGLSGRRSYGFPPESTFAVWALLLVVLMWISLFVVVLGLHWHSLSFYCVYFVIFHGRNFISSAYTEVVNKR